MSKQIAKEVVNFILVLAYSYIHYFYISRYIFDLTGSRMLSVGVWSIIVGIWGNLVGMRLVKAIYISEDYRRQNFFYIMIGFCLSVAGIILSI